MGQELVYYVENVGRWEEGGYHTYTLRELSRADAQGVVLADIEIKKGLEPAGADFKQLRKDQDPDVALTTKVASDMREKLLQGSPAVSVRTISRALGGFGAILEKNQVKNLLPSRK